MLLKRNSKWGLLATSLLATGLVVAGCGNASASHGSQKQTSSGNGSTVADTTLKMAPGVAGDFQRNFNPFAGNAAPGTNGMIYQSLYYFNTVGPQKYGLLASNYSWSNGNKTLTVDLRKNVKWTDGKPFSANDVVFTFNLMKKYPAIDTNGIWSKISSVKKAGSDKVVFQFKQPNVPFAWYVLTTLIVPQHIWSTLGNPAKASVTNPVGTGPYELASFSPQSFTLKANSQYYLGAPAVKNVQMTAYSDNNSATLGLVKNNVSWSGIFIPNIQNVYTSKSANNKYWFPPSNVEMLYTNLKDPLLSQLPVRQAISLAINRNEVTKKAEDGYVDVASPTGLVLPNDKSWLDPKLANQHFSYNPKKAIQILQNAGFKKNSSGIFVSPDGKPLSFTLQNVPGWTDISTAASLISSELKQIGIKVTIENEQDAAYTANLSSHKFQMALSWTDAGPGPYYLYENLLGANGGWNIEQWSNASTEQALNTFAATTNQSVQRQQIYKLENTMVNDLPAIPIFYAVHWDEYNDSQFTGWPTAKNPYAVPSSYEWPSPAIVITHLKPVK